MEITTLNIDDVKEWENNARIHTKKNIDALKKSLSAWKQTKPILVQKSTMRIIAGNGTYQAIRALGWKTVDCNILDIDDKQAEALAIADNRTGLLSQWDEKILTDTLKDLQFEGNLELTGFDSMELDKMLSFQNGDMFEKLTPKAAPEQKPKESDFSKVEKALEPPSLPKEDKTVQEGDTVRDKGSTPYNQQVSFNLFGFVFTLSNENELRELHDLIEFLKESPKKDREEVNALVFEKIEEVLTEKFMR